MPVEYKDYYSTLGLARTATPEEIRRAFRRLARECHPDVATQEVEAAVRFREINEAYEVLSDPGKRSTYDSLDRGWWYEPGASSRSHRDSGNRPHTRAQTKQGSTFEFCFGGTTGFSEFFEHVFGAQAQRSPDPSPSANDQGAQSGRRGQDVESEILVSLSEVMSGAIRPLALQREVTCPLCDGTGAAHTQRCRGCNGKGEILQRQRYQLRIPAGVKEGQRLRVAGEGSAGEESGRAGDLYLRVRYAKHPDFQVEGANLVCEVRIAPWEAVLGAQVTVATLNQNVSIRIPAGSQNGQRLRVRAQGLPQSTGERGDLHVILNIQVPQTLTDRERALWVQLAAQSSYRARAI